MQEPFGGFLRINVAACDTALAAVVQRRVWEQPLVRGERGDNSALGRHQDRRPRRVDSSANLSRGGSNEVLQFGYFMTFYA